MGDVVRLLRVDVEAGKKPLVEEGPGQRGVAGNQVEGGGVGIVFAVQQVFQSGRLVVAQILSMTASITPTMRNTSFGFPSCRMKRVHIWRIYSTERE